MYTVLFVVCSGLGLEEEVPDYDLDSEDEEWLSAQTKERVSPCRRGSINEFNVHFFPIQPLSPLHFEKMMDKLERGSGNTVSSIYCLSLKVSTVERFNFN